MCVFVPSYESVEWQSLAEQAPAHAKNHNVTKSDVLISDCQFEMN